MISTRPTQAWPVRLRSRLSLNAQLILVYSSLMTISVVLLSIFSFSSMRSIVAELKLQNTREVVEQIRNNVDTNLVQIDKLSYVVFSNTDVLRILRENQGSLGRVSSRERFLIEGLLTDVLFARDDISGLVLYDNYGSSLRTHAPPSEIPFETIARLADEADGSLTWVPREAGNSIIFAVRKVYDLEIKPLGYLRIDTWASHLEQRLSDTMKEIGGSIAIIQNGRTIVGTSHYPDGGSDPGVAPGRGDETTDEMYELDDSIVVSLQSRVNDWRFSGSAPLAAVYRDIRYLRTVTLLASVVAVAVFVFASSLIARGFVRPIHKIADQMKAASIGEWSPELGTAANNEIAYLETEFGLMIQRINELVARSVEAESRTARQRLEVLQAQINPHFLYNALDVVNWMARRQGAPDIAEIVGALSTIMRYSISGESMTSLGLELRHVEHYVLIQRARFRDRFTVDIQVPEDLTSVELPKLTLQPLVENAILHGFKGLGRPGYLRVQVEMVGSDVHVNIHDNGVGMEPERLEELLRAEGDNHGIGVANVHRRLQLTYGDQYGLQIKSEVGVGTDLVVMLPRSAGGNRAL